MVYFSAEAAGVRRELESSMTYANSLTIEVLFSVLFRCEAIAAFEVSAKMTPILYVHDVHYFLDAQKRGFE